MIDELVNTITQKTGLSPEQARSAADTVLEFVKGRIGEPLASQLDSLMAGNTETAATGGNILSGAAAKLGSLFGKGE